VNDSLRKSKQNSAVKTDVFNVIIASSSVGLILLLFQAKTQITFV